MKTLSNVFGRRLRPLAVVIVGFIVIAGCASATGTPTQRASMELPRPDRVLVYDFAVTPEQVALDRGIGPRVMRTVAPPQTEEEIKVGEVVARALSDGLVSELRAHGIDAHLASKSARPGKPPDRFAAVSCISMKAIELCAP